MSRSELPPSTRKALSAFEDAVDAVVQAAAEEGRSLVVCRDGKVELVPARELRGDEVSQATAGRRALPESAPA